MYNLRSLRPVFVDNVLGSKLYSPRTRGWVPPPMTHYYQGGPGGPSKSRAGLLEPQHAALRHDTMRFGNGFSTSFCAKTVQFVLYESNACACFDHLSCFPIGSPADGMRAVRASLSRVAFLCLSLMRVSRARERNSSRAPALSRLVWVAASSTA